MELTIEFYRHQESIKDPVRGKIPTPEGIARSYETGLRAYQEHPESVFRGFHSNAVRTKMALDAYLLGAGNGTAEHLDALDEFEIPAEIRNLRKELGDSESCRVRLGRYDQDDREESKEVQNYYRTLYSKARSLADLVREAKEDSVEKHETIVSIGHEPVLSVSLVELAKYGLGYEGEDNAEFFRELAGCEDYFFPEGEGYKVELKTVEGRVITTLVTNAGEFELKL